MAGMLRHAVEACSTAHPYSHKPVTESNRSVLAPYLALLLEHCLLEGSMVHTDAYVVGGEGHTDICSRQFLLQQSTNTKSRGTA